MTPRRRSGSASLESRTRRVEHNLAGLPRLERVAKNALLRPLRSAATCINAGLHGGKRMIADKDEVPGSSPGRPTPIGVRTVETLVAALQVAVQSDASH